MKTIVAICLIFSLVSCAAGPVYVARNETESVKRMYTEPALQTMYYKNQDLLRNIYNRFTGSRVDFFNEGLGFTTLSDQKGRKHPYLMIYIRPSEITFDVNKTTGQQRFGVVLRDYLPRYVAHLRDSDLGGEDVQGLAFGVYWPVRDFSQCQQAGGFVEYLHIYLQRDDARDLIEGKASLFQLLEYTEVFTSLDQAPAISVRPML
jgi:hypothetical protein